MNDTQNSKETPAKPKRSWFQFSLRTILLVALLVAVFLSGRNSNRWFEPALEGKWEMTLPRGFKSTTNITRDPDGFYVLGTGGVLSGVYELRDDRLVVVKPSDERMIDLVWARVGNQLQLVSEPKGTPTGASYIGAVMELVDEQKTP